MTRFLAPLVLLASLNLGLGLTMSAHAGTTEYNSEDSTVGDLLDNPKTKAVLEQLIPTFVNAERIDDALGMTLREVQPYAADLLTDEVLAKIDAELAKVTATK